MALVTTLAVLSFATAVKDIVELARQIRDAFDKVPQNYRNARNLSKDIFQFAESIQILYDARKDIVEKSPMLEKSLHDLLQKMHNVKDECTRLIPPISEKKRDKFKMGFYAFRNRGKVENLISELKGRTHDCYRHFLLLSSIRIETTVNQIETMVNRTENVVNRTETTVNQIALRVQSLSIRDSTYTTSSSTTSNQLFQFSGSSTLPMTWMRDTIPEHDLHNAYIRSHLGTTEKLLGSLTSKWSQKSLECFSTDPMSSLTYCLYKSALSDSEYHQKVVVEIFQLQTLIRGASLSDITDITFQAENLSLSLWNQGMHEEVLLVMKWCVGIMRCIVSIFPSSNARLRLAFHLTELHNCYTRLNDYDKAYIASRESTEICHSLSLIYSSPSLQVQLITAESIFNLSRIPSSLTAEHTKPIELAERAVGLIQLILADSTPLPIFSSIDLPWINFIPSVNYDTMLSGGTSPDYLYRYALYLQNLAGHQDVYNALCTRKHVLAILHSLLLKYLNSRNLLETTAGLLATMVSDHTLSDRLHHANKCVDIYRQLLGESRSPKYLLRLSTALQSLLQLETDDQKCAEIFAEITSLADAASHKYFDINLPSETQGDYYMHLAEVHKNAGRLPDAIHAAQNSVAQYAALGFIDKDRDPMKHIEALAMLLRLYFDCEQYQSAVWEGRKAIKLITSASGAHYMTPFKTIVDTLKNLRPGPNPGTLIQCVPSPENFQAMFESELTNPSFVELHVQCLLRMVMRHLTAYSDREQRRSTTQFVVQAINFLSKFKYLSSMRKLTEALTLSWIDLLLRDQKYQEALQHCQDITRMNRTNVNADYKFIMLILDRLFWSQIYCHFPQEAVCTATEMLSRCRITMESENRTCSWLPFSLRALAVALFDDGNIEDALVHIQEARELDGAENRQRIMQTVAELHFAKFNQVKSNQMVLYIRPTQCLKDHFSICFCCGEELTWILFQGVVHCCSGDHDKGLAALEEFVRLIKNIVTRHPDSPSEIQHALDVRKRHGKWKLIEGSARSTLQCDHMEEVLKGNWVEIAGLDL